MIQELLSAVVEERKFSFTGGGLLSDAPSPFLSSASAAAAIQSSSTPSPSAIPEPPQQKLRCPRCDSSNTKFCYYNNYNLTQPRHFCKTCRRYWTKGGALRNVPIGGGCRKSKPSPNIAPGGCSGKPGSASKSCKPISSIDAIARAGFGLESDLFQPSPIIWAAPPPHHNSHLLALLRAGGGSGGGFRNFDPNPLHNLSSIRIKEEVIGPESVGHGTGQPGPSYDPLGQFSTGVGSLWRNDGQLQYLQLQENTSPFGDSSAGIQELYQRLRPQAAPMMAGSYCSDQLSMSSDGYGMAPACSPSTPSTAITSSIAGGGGASTAQVLATVQPIMGAEFGYWNPTLPWSDMSSAN